MKPRHSLWEYGLAVILLAVAFCPRTAHPQAPTMTAAIDPGITEYLETLADTRMEEDAYCLTGDVHKGDTVDTLFIHAIAFTPWLVQDRRVTDTSASIAWPWWNCPPTTVALWHSHPIQLARRIPMFDLRNCHFSGPDRSILADRRSPALSLVSVQRGVTCVFARQGDGTIVQVPFSR